jgi:hypothetical protein
VCQRGQKAVRMPNQTMNRPPALIATTCPNLKAHSNRHFSLLVGREPFENVAGKHLACAVRAGTRRQRS